MAPKPKPITVVHNFGGRRGSGVPVSVLDWGLWDCDPTKTGAPSRQHAYGKDFPWMFDKLEKAYILEGEATLTPDDPTLHGEAVRIVPKDMVTFPKGWKGRWEVHSFLKKHYAFFDGKGLRVDEAISESEEEEEEEAKPSKAVAKSAKGKSSPKPARGEAKPNGKANATASGGAKAKTALKSRAPPKGGRAPASKRRKP